MAAQETLLQMLGCLSALRGGGRGCCGLLWVKLLGTPALTPPCRHPTRCTCGAPASCRLPLADPCKKEQQAPATVAADSLLLCLLLLLGPAPGAHAC
jgi:hypothetical protein